MTGAAVRRPPDASGKAGIVDFTRSIPPLPDGMQACLQRALSSLALDPQLAMRTRCALPGGADEDRVAGAAWLEPRFGEPVSPDRLIVTSGTQSALFLLFDGLVGRDGLVLAEALTWGVMKDLARDKHVHLKGLAIDDHGIIPEAFEAACKAERPKALYCNPTDQNPTTAIMPEARRIALAQIARRYRVPIIEDDALGRLHPGAPRPIAALAPDIVWYLMGLTKCLSHGLRLAYLAGPSAPEIDRVIGPARRLSHWFPNPLTAAVVSRWIADGSANEICDAIRRESEARQRLAADLLDGADVVTKPGAMHLWLRLPSGTDRREFAAALERQGVLVRPAELFAVDDVPPENAVRLSLSSPLDRSAVQRGLRIVAQTLGLTERPLSIAAGDGNR